MNESEDHSQNGMSVEPSPNGKEKDSQTLPSILLAITQRNHLVYTEAALHSLSFTSFPGGVAVFDDGSEDEAWKKFSDEYVEHLDYYEFEPEAQGTTAMWNRILSYADRERYEFVVVSNNDVLFTPNWWPPLLQAFAKENCGISGPMTNQPGHQPRQLLPLQSPVEFIEHSRSRAPIVQGFCLEYVNGFCFCLKMDRISWFDEEAKVTFDPSVKDYGAEDEYQKRMRSQGLMAYAMQDSRVFHFKDVSYESFREGRLDYLHLPHRLKEDKDWVEPEKETV